MFPAQKNPIGVVKLKTELLMTEKLVIAGSAGRLKLIAVFEALKGLLALSLGFGMMASLDESVGEAAQELVLGLHLDPSKRLPDMFIDATTSLHREQLWIVITSAVAYSMVRFAEAYGLWNKRRWAAWLSALSGGIYLPLEAYELWNKISWFHVVAALANVAIVTYMIILLWQSQRSARVRILKER
jgi:uncharacterized membrane protein (DUF2068 family)